jgi:hypothetical protein
VSLDWKLLVDLPPSELVNRLSAEVETLMEGRSGADEDELLAQLPEPLRAVWLIDWLDFEVSQGSLLAYFFNSHGRHAALAIDLLHRMGAHGTADVLAEAATSHEVASAEWQTRHDELDIAGEHAVVTPYAGPSNARDLDVLTDQYWQAAEADNWGAKLESYLSAQVRLLAG